MTDRLDPSSRIRIVCVGAFGSDTTTTLGDLYAMDVWEEYGGALNLEAALRRDGKYVDDGGSRTITLVGPPSNG